MLGNRGCSLIYRDHDKIACVCLVASSFHRAAIFSIIIYRVFFGIFMCTTMDAQMRDGTPMVNPLFCLYPGFRDTWVLDLLVNCILMIVLVWSKIKFTFEDGNFTVDETFNYVTDFRGKKFTFWSPGDEKPGSDSVRATGQTTDTNVDEDRDPVCTVVDKPLLEGFTVEGKVRG
ncbi:hypothetical protein F5X99DRAFT_428723 [Biscogniauxia marginata]|nr:hypothetical protein F5X99DRAFT_428723 [Biscogniauxia marginata]